MVQDDKNRVASNAAPWFTARNGPTTAASALNLVLPDNAALKGEFRPDILNGIEVVTGQMQAVVRDADGVAIKTVPHNLVAIPYYAWANSGIGEMTVWIARDQATATDSNPFCPSRSPKSAT